MATSEQVPGFEELPLAERQGRRVAVLDAASADGYAALRESAALVALDHRGLLRIEGPDAADLLQRVCSQDAVGMPVGGGAPATLMTGKGKLEAVFELFRLDQELFVAECDAADVATLRALIDRYVFAERVELEVCDLRGLGVFGPDAVESVAAAASWQPNDAAAACGKIAPTFAEGVFVGSTSLGVPAIRVFAPARYLSVVADACSGLPRAGWDEYEALRIDAGFPRFGQDADNTTIPLEANLDAACDPDKGCYIGQEIVARIRTYGHVNRALVRIHSQDPIDAIPASGTLLYDEGIEAGRLTSAYISPLDQRLHALAMLPAILDDDVDLHLGGPDGPAITILADASNA